jgi:hypothetical protein
MSQTLLRVHGVLLTAAVLWGCAAPEPQGLRRSDEGTGAEVKFDFFARPLPEIPLPNDLATRYDASSPTKRRLNASLLAPTGWEKAVREQLSELDGWGTFAPISLSFTAPLDVEVIYERHRDDYDFGNDAVYLFDVSSGSPDFCQAMPLDLGEGNFPFILERQAYYPNDPRGDTQTLVFEDVDEDLNGNGILDPGEDTDRDGVLDVPNLRRKGGHPIDDLLTFYERETHTLILRPLTPLRENTTYAVVITRRLLDETGAPVRSPFEYINHTAQTEALRPLPGCIDPYGLTLQDVAFTWSFTTQSITRDLRAVRDGLYGIGPMAWVAEKYPPKLQLVHKLKKNGSRVVSGEELLTVARNFLPALGGGADDPKVQEILKSHRFIGKHIVASFESPQFFPRHDEDGAPLPLHQQVWKLNPTTGEAFHRPERVTMWITLPRDEVAQKPYPVVILGHGYTGNKLDPLFYGGFFARHGIATLGMEAVSHGIAFDSTEVELARGMFNGSGLEPFVEAIMFSRSVDQNGDGKPDSGADFWTAYAFHTRDLLRQSAVDYMRAVQILRSFDGQQLWDFDINGNGIKDDLAGDFDGDGVVDVGGAAPLHMSGGSLGGILSSLMGGAEPQLQTVVPIAGGGGLPDIGVRSVQGGVAEAVNLRMMGPLLISLPAAEGGGLELWQYLPDLNALGRVKLGALSGTFSEGDTVIVRNLRSFEHRCAPVLEGGLFRAAVSSDDLDPLRLEFYAGPLLPEARTGCQVPPGTEPYHVVDSFGQDVTFQTRSWARGSPLLAMGDGFGLRRASPESRRFLAIAQIILDPADPVNWAPFFEDRILEYGTGEVVRTRAVVVNTIGDMNVPVSTGASLARAAGFIPFEQRDARWNKTANQVLIDTGVLEAVERTGRHFNSQGAPVLMDVEHLATITGVDDGFDVPRLAAPMRLVGPSARVGGVTGVLFPMVVPTGRHGFDTPNPTDAFDIGSFMANVISRYVRTGGEEWEFLPCHVDGSCPWIPAFPDP